MVVHRRFSNRDNYIKNNKNAEENPSTTNMAGHEIVTKKPEIGTFCVTVDPTIYLFSSMKGERSLSFSN